MNYQLPNFKKIKYLLIIIIFIFSILAYPNIISNNKNQIWLEINPIKCLGNPWEFHWLKNNPSQYADYPGIKNNNINKFGIELLKNYYKNKNINIINVESIPFKNQNNINLASCTACSCPQGYTLYVLLHANDVKKMLELGWKKSNAKFE